MTIIDKFTHFIRGLTVNWCGRAGVILTTSAFIIFILLEAARMVGLLTNAYVGLITYLLFPALFIIGLLLIPVGWRIYRKKTGRRTRELLSERFDPEANQAGMAGSGVFRTIAILTLINILFMGGASVQMLHFMDRPNFCGTACHSVMNPEWVTYQDSPHARVRCVECHVGEGIGAAIDAKLNGVWQMISVTFNLYERPIPTPVHNLRPARETCEKCHWPDKFYGNRLKTIFKYDHDENSTPCYTTLALKVDAGLKNKKAGIHWHTSETNEVHYASVDDKRKDMIWVGVLRPDGSYHRYFNDNLKDAPVSYGNIRTLDCVDCHNRATHIYEDPEKALDDRMRLGLFNVSWPYFKREALTAITRNYATQKAALRGIADHLEGFYSRAYPQKYGSGRVSLDTNIIVLREIYRRNIHERMNIKWGSYANNIGHRGNGGCFRCHNDELRDDSGRTISFDCALCHSVLANNESNPFYYLIPADTSDRNFEMHKYLRDEFFNSYLRFTTEK
nr:NapC/NirT family cytochrome c [candidate division Zixibacteria bacterium]